MNGNKTTHVDYDQLETMLINISNPKHSNLFIHVLYVGTQCNLFIIIIINYYLIIIVVVVVVVVVVINYYLIIIIIIIII